MKNSLRLLLQRAVNDLREHGYDSEHRLKNWIRLIRIGTFSDVPSDEILQSRLNRAMLQMFNKSISKGWLEKTNPGVAMFTVDRLKPKLQAELNRRILASTDLIKLNRTKAVEQTIQRFAGWASSVPLGGTDRNIVRETTSHILKPIYSLSYEERRLHIDQGHKLLSSVSEIIAHDSGAIAMKWRSHWKQAGYNYRVDHKERDGRFYAIRGNWALKDGLMNKGDGYTDEMTKVGEEVNCRCFAVYAYSLGDLPADMLTEKGKSVLAETRLRKS